MLTAPQIRDSLAEVRQELLAARLPAGYWEGRLASSALSTATAISALALLQRNAQANEARDAARRRGINAGLTWLAEQQNADGGFGDTDLSHSNIATSMLISAAIRLAGEPNSCRDMLQRCDDYIQRQGGIPALRARYGKDKTFAVPILTNCALAGMVEWREVSPLPFELAVFPQGFFRFLRLPVVSYAIPALVAIGQARYFHRKPKNPITRGIRAAASAKSLRVLEKMQPESGGFLEATPLTAFVTMSLASIGHADHVVARRGEAFLLASLRDDGSWPIDTNLATWNTTLSLNALLGTIGDEPSHSQLACTVGQASGGARSQAVAAENGADDSSCDADIDQLDDALQPRLLDWLLSCQHREVHPYTGAAPGGWAWTDLTGGVPDVDDTSGALLALARWFRFRDERDELSRKDKARLLDAAKAGIGWLLAIQNGDGGWPTFCRGWGTMPFDRSSTDLTAHAIRGMHAWRPMLAAQADLKGKIERATERGFRFLTKSQDDGGFWTPLWFGNQDHPAEENPIYGTSKVLLAYAELDRRSAPEAIRAGTWLRGVQNADGGWGGDGQRSSVEETALSVEAISSLIERDPANNSAENNAWQAGIDWLVAAIRENCHRKPSPIGFYFAKLWYYEDLYPLIFTAAALQAALRSAGAFDTAQSALPLAAASATT